MGYGKFQSRNECQQKENILKETHVDKDFGFVRVLMRRSYGTVAGCMCAMASPMRIRIHHYTTDHDMVQMMSLDSPLHFTESGKKMPALFVSFTHAGIAHL